MRGLTTINALALVSAHLFFLWMIADAKADYWKRYALNLESRVRRKPGEKEESNEQK